MESTIYFWILVGLCIINLVLMGLNYFGKTAENILSNHLNEEGQKLISKEIDKLEKTK